ncbi:hypothetical protein BOQ62_00385 [Chryseobacterium sp. CH21]|nr:hypothetical protein BOQ62_00385 [Chryseobacterium sp. CH21]
MKQKILFIIPCNASLGHLLPETFRPYFIFIKNKYVIDFAISKEQSTARSTKMMISLILIFSGVLNKKIIFS